MKHLKSYSIFESVSEIDIESIKSDINDIFLDAQDIGFKIEVDIEDVSSFFSLVNMGKESSSYKFKFRLIRPSEDDPGGIDFNIDLVNDDIIRMVDYMESVLGKEVDDIYLFTMPKLWDNWDAFVNNRAVINSWLQSEVYVFKLDFWIHL